MVAGACFFHTAACPTRARFARRSFTENLSHMTISDLQIERPVDPKARPQTDALAPRPTLVKTTFFGENPFASFPPMADPGATGKAPRKSSKKAPSASKLS